MVISSNIILENPLFGIGWANFSSRYNLEQAEYFSEHPDSSFYLLADDHGVSFNEFIRIWAELGIWGFLIFVFVIYTLLKGGFKKGSHPMVKAWVASLSSILTFAFFSYPFSNLFIVANFIFAIAGLSANIDFAAKSLIVVKGIYFSILTIFCITFMFLYNLTIYKKKLEWEAALQIVQYEPKKGLSIYQSLYPELQDYSSFLYNYGYELSQNGQYLQSIEVLNDAKLRMVNTDICLRLGYNYNQIGDFQEAEKQYLLASHMVPSRFVPKYLLMSLYAEHNENSSAYKMAKQIINMDVKVESKTTDYIVAEANKIIESYPQSCHD